MKVVDKVKELAARKSCTPGQLALAWVHAQGPDVFPIPGTKRVKYLEVRSITSSISQGWCTTGHAGKTSGMWRQQSFCYSMAHCDTCSVHYKHVTEFAVHGNKIDPYLERTLAHQLSLSRRCCIP